MEGEINITYCIACFLCVMCIAAACVSINMIVVSCQCLELEPCDILFNWVSTNLISLVVSSDTAVSLMLGLGSCYSVCVCRCILRTRSLPGQNDA